MTGDFSHESPSDKSQRMFVKIFYKMCVLLVFEVVQAHQYKLMVDITHPEFSVFLLERYASLVSGYRMFA